MRSRMVGERNLAGTGNGAASDESDIGDRVMRTADGPMTKRQPIGLSAVGRNGLHAEYLERFIRGRWRHD